MYAYAPTTGTIIAYKFTETQFNGIYYITGQKSVQETIVGANKVIQL